MGEVLGKDLAAMGELSARELALWVAHLAKRRELEDVKWDLRFYGLCEAVRSCHFKGLTFDPETYFPALFKPTEAEPEEEDEDDGQLERRMMAWCLAVGGTVNAGDEQEQPNERRDIERDEAD